MCFDLQYVIYIPGQQKCVLINSVYIINALFVVIKTAVERLSQ